MGDLVKESTLTERVLFFVVLFAVVFSIMLLIEGFKRATVEAATCSAALEEPHHAG